ncbi:hypothetical protein B0H17DRAFT_1131791 [Mycena rosella]|uniref:Uncharacterized protein n=1 Tax=Mycena rosella TaxID=1033263 RepID=A0AAD7DP71_MYCRO|nr:hypothetical protein B0H17DRAFT_1131791 [Mycena rosella]
MYVPGPTVHRHHPAEGPAPFGAGPAAANAFGSRPGCCGSSLESVGESSARGAGRRVLERKLVVQDARGEENWPHGRMHQGYPSIPSSFGAGFEAKSSIPSLVLDRRRAQSAIQKFGIRAGVQSGSDVSQDFHSSRAHYGI